VIIGKTFAWGHIPKTGGDATAALVGLFPDLIDSSDPADSNEKHSLFRDREEEIDGKLLVLNIRRLPSWLLSRAHHAAAQGVFPDYKPTPMQSPHQMAESQFPDGWLSYFTDNGRLRIDRWLRMEHLVEDFFELVSELTDVSEEQRQGIFALGQVKERPTYDPEPYHWFTEEQVRRMYENNPLWRAVERQVYREWPRLT
jgi:hypothetical protein